MRKVDLTSRLPEGYHLDLVDDPCVIVLRRPDGTLVARFGRHAVAQEIRQAAEEDHRTLRARQEGRRGSLANRDPARPHRPPG
jgi:hypothetical protein